jgi:hypothetical protein
VCVENKASSTTQQKNENLLFATMKKRKKKEGNQRNQILTRTHTRRVGTEKNLERRNNAREKMEACFNKRFTRIQQAKPT